MSIESSKLYLFTCLAMILWSVVLATLEKVQAVLLPLSVRYFWTRTKLKSTLCILWIFGFVVQNNRLAAELYYMPELIKKVQAISVYASCYVTDLVPPIITLLLNICLITGLCYIRRHHSLSARTSSAISNRIGPCVQWKAPVLIGAAAITYQVLSSRTLVSLIIKYLPDDKIKSEWCYNGDTGMIDTSWCSFVYSAQIEYSLWLSFIDTLCTLLFIKLMNYHRNFLTFVVRVLSSINKPANFFIYFLASKNFRTNFEQLSHSFCQQVWLLVVVFGSNSRILIQCLFNKFCFKTRSPMSISRRLETTYENQHDSNHEEVESSL